MKDMLISTVTTIGGGGLMVVYALFGIGTLYWLWMAIQIGNFWMFVMGVIPPTILFAAPLGAWSLLFGMPEWLSNHVGAMPI